MKKVAVALMLVLAALALVACGGSSGSSTEPTAAPETGAEEAGGEAGTGEGESEGGEEAGEASAPVLKIEAAETGLAYASETASVEAGDVTIEFTNPQPVAHDVAIETFNGEVLGQTELVTEGTTSTEIELKPGTYKYFCTVPGHREAGMEGILTVE